MANLLGSDLCSRIGPCPCHTTTAAHTTVVDALTGIAEVLVADEIQL
jgi:hypothetical protein